MSVSSTQRFSKQNPCPICEGYKEMPQGQGTRCWGYLSDDGQWAYCTRPEYARTLTMNSDTGAYAHKLHGDCRCGVSHDGTPSAPRPSINGKSNNFHRVIAETYDYRNHKSEVIFQTVRYDPKGFSQRRPDGNGGWIRDLKGVQPTLYRLPELLAADPNKPVFIPEGEKHVDRLTELGLVATTFPMGALKSHLVKNVSALKDWHVVVLPDNDPPNAEKPAEHLKGQRHAQQVAQRLYPVAKSVRVLELPGLPEKGDILDWLDAGNSVDDLMGLARHCPEWNPDEAELLDTEPDSEEIRLHTTLLADVVPEQVKPLWPKRIFRGKLAVMVGDPGVGKSYASLDIAARVSLGGPWPDGSGNAPKGNVLLLSAEDGLADTVKPRLELLGADMNHIHSLRLTVSKGAEEIGLSLQQHLLEIERFIVENDIILMVADPLLAFTGKTDTHKTAEVRALLSPMAAMAERTGCAILAVMHPNKNSQEGNALYRISASLDFAAAARSVMVVVAKHPDDPEQRVVATIKCNLTAHPEPMAFGFTHGGHFTWMGVTEVDVSRLMAPPVRDEDRNEREEAKDFLKSLLADGPVPAPKVQQESKELGISNRTLSRAKSDLGVVSLRSGAGEEGHGKGRGKTATWHWHLPETFKDATPPTPTSGNLKNLESKGHPADTDQGEMFKDASGNLKSTLHGGNLKEASPDPKSSTNPVRVFKDANPGGQEVAILNDEVVTDQPSSDEALSPSPESRSVGTTTLYSDQPTFVDDDKPDSLEF